MTSSVAILFAMDTRNVPAPILQEADARYHKRAKEQYKAYMGKQYEKLCNVVIENLPSINGLPLSAYLNRMRGVMPMFRLGTTPLESLIETDVSKLIEADSGSSSDGKVTAQEKVQAIRNLCRYAADPKDADVFSNWLGTNAHTLNEGIANSLGTDNRDLMQELCFGVAYLTRAFRFGMHDKLELVIAALVRAMALALIPWENYVEQFRDAKERHNDIELARGRPIVFHYPRMEYLFSEVNHRVLGCIYYTLGDILFNCPTPKLIHFFECRIFRRKEMTRNLLFTILHVVVINLTDLQSEAEHLADLEKKSGLGAKPMGRTTSPLSSRRGKPYSESMWNDLPGTLYADIIRVYNDRNRANKVLINEIMAMLRALAPEKLPLFEEATLKALELYTGAGGGRLTETYQIGRAGQMGREGEGSTSQRRRKSGAAKSIAGTAVAGTSAGEKDGGTGAQRSSTTTNVDAEQAEKPAETRRSSSSSTETSSEVNYSSDSNKQETQISRRTLIVPKIPDLIQPTRTHRK
ncbi:unnamed protein product [Calicophoron daubneyi]|uniref:Uncharacterized protein n=1 Tax=Calicophoron daubneyi TaxID=300641 RepID=A0AAV2T4X1_CALDB